jgi:3-oxoacyl-(acyl-carrier-protein) synthase
MAGDGLKASSSGGGAGIEAMMKQLGIDEDDLDNVVFEEEGPPSAEATRCLAIARVFTSIQPFGFSKISG